MNSLKREKRIHVLSNEVTLTDVVNAILAVGGTAICGNDSSEVEEITAICDGLVLNIGMPSDVKLRAMILSGKKANEKGIPVLLDPVGVGASIFRKEMVKKLLSEVSFSCIKGNYSEIAYLCGKKIRNQGIDGGEESLLIEEMRELSKKTEAIIVATGEKNLIVDEDREVIIDGGSSLLKRITGSGCMLSGVLTTFLAGEEEAGRFDAVKEGSSFFNLSAKKTEDLMRSEGRGLGSFKVYFMDELSQINSEEVKKEAK